MNKIRYLLYLLLAFSFPSHADSWQFPKQNSVDKFRFGDTLIERIVDSSENQQYPEFAVKIYKKNKLLAIYPGVSFTAIKPDKFNNTFIGLSNSGLPGTALFILQASGSMSVIANHSIFHPFYCDESATVQRKWFDETNPDIRFIYEDEQSDRLQAITFRNCQGKVEDLTDAIFKGYQNAAEKYFSLKPKETN